MSEMKTFGLSFSAVILMQLVLNVNGFVYYEQLNKNATYLEAKVGSYVVFNCPLEFPQDNPIPYVLHWNKDVSIIQKVYDFQ